MYKAKLNLTPSAAKLRKKFLKFFPGGYYDETYIAWERDYKWNAHIAWEASLNKKDYSSLLRNNQYKELALRAVNIESKTNLLFSFEKMALRDAVKSEEGAEAFAKGLYEFLYGKKSDEKKFHDFAEVISKLPRKQTRVLTWPLLTVFGFISQPEKHIFLKPRVTQIAAGRYGFDFEYTSKPNWNTYQSVLNFAETVRKDTSDLKPRDMIDHQSYIWVAGSDEY